MNIELMAPAGNLKSFIASIESGANSVYLGYKKFNARRPADNFDLADLKKITDYAHSKGVKVYLTLNIDLKSNELKEAAALVAYAVEIGIDALIVKDFSIIELVNRFYKGKIELHLSTQTAITSSLGASFARTMGADRIVLARELELEEIKKIAALDNLETEIFTEGSMCFSISGRCFMSSWVGGRSGNRGACTAPCRIPWTGPTGKGNLFSMKDLSLISSLKAVEAAGVDSLKIEGRLKSAGWVKSVVSLYKKALSSMEDSEEIDRLREELRKYSAREVTESHLFSHQDLTGKNEDWEGYVREAAAVVEIPEEFRLVDNLIIVKNEESGITVTIKVGGLSDSFTTPFPPKPKKAKTVEFALLEEWLADEIMNEKFTVEMDSFDLEAASNQLNKIYREIHKRAVALLKRSGSLPVVKGEISSFINGRMVETKRAQLLGSTPDKVIIGANQAELFAKSQFKLNKLVLELSTETKVETVERLAQVHSLTLAIPEVLFEESALKIESLVNKLYEQGHRDFEANSLTGFGILDKIDCNRYLGSGWPLFNQAAAEFFYSRGYRSIYVSPEADSSVYKGLSSFAGGGVEAVVFARLPLFISRVFGKEFKNGAVYKDKFVDIECFMRNELNYFIESEPYSLLSSKVRAEKIFVDSQSIDLRYFKDPQNTLNMILQGKFDGKYDKMFNFFSKLV